MVFDSNNFSNSAPQLISTRIIDFVNNINKNSPTQTNVIGNVSSFFTKLYNYFLRENILLLLILIGIGLFLYHRYKNKKDENPKSKELDIDLYIDENDISLELDDIKLIEQIDFENQN